MTKTKLYFSNAIYSILLLMVLSVVSFLIVKFLFVSYLHLQIYLIRTHWFWNIAIIFLLISFGGFVIGSAITGISYLASIVNLKFPNNKTKTIITIILTSIFSIVLIVLLWFIPHYGFWSTILTIIFSIVILALHIPFVILTTIDND